MTATSDIRYTYSTFRVIYIFHPVTKRSDLACFVRANFVSESEELGNFDEIIFDADQRGHNCELARHSLRQVKRNKLFNPSTFTFNIYLTYIINRIVSPINLMKASIIIFSIFLYSGPGIIRQSNTDSSKKNNKKVCGNIFVPRYIDNRFLWSTRQKSTRSYKVIIFFREIMSMEHYSHYIVDTLEM